VARQHMDDEGTRVERADDEQGRAECKLALACLRYEQEWPSLAKAEKPGQQDKAAAAHTILMWIRRRRLTLARLQCEQEWPLLNQAEEH
jgi:hypothetical protein